MNQRPTWTSFRQWSNWPGPRCPKTGTVILRCLYCVVQRSLSSVCWFVARCHASSCGFWDPRPVMGLTDGSADIKRPLSIPLSQEETNSRAPMQMGCVELPFFFRHSVILCLPSVAIIGCRKAAGEMPLAPPRSHPTPFLLAPLGSSQLQQRERHLAPHLSAPFPSMSSFSKF